MSIDDEEIESERNGEMTYRYHVERNGFLVASMLNLQNFSKGSREYKRILEFILNRILQIIPQPYRTSSNYYYYFLKELLRSCIDEYQEILDYFFNIVFEKQDNLLINFSSLRSKINGKIYKKIIVDDRFRLLFYRALYDFKTPFWANVSESDDKESRISQEREEAIHLIKMQLKLDIEAYIDKDISEVLKISTDPVKSIRYRNRQDMAVSHKKLLEDHQNNQVIAKKVLDFEARNEWEKERNNNLSNHDLVTLIIRCSNLECNGIYPHSFEIEKEIFDEIPCKFCGKNAIANHMV